jgi:hypothetical protein
MEQISFTGGARIGMANATIPFASLKVSKNRLNLDVSVIGNFVFRPEDIISIEAYTLIPLLGQGIRINHKVPEYKKKIIFWTMNNPKEIIKQIQKIGFLDNHASTDFSQDSERIIQKQQQGGFSIKKSFAIGLFILWDLLFLFDVFNFISGGFLGIRFGYGITLGIGIVFLSSLLTIISPDFRKIVLKEGRELEDIRQALNFILFISGFMLVVFVFVFLFSFVG